MANWSNLKVAVSNIIKTNNNKEITGSVLQSVLLNIISNFGNNITYLGAATPSTNPGAPDGPVFYFAFKPGTYPNFGGATVTNTAQLFIWNNSSWSSVDTGLLTGEYCSNKFTAIDKLIRDVSDEVDTLSYELTEYSTETDQRFAELDERVSNLISSLPIVWCDGGILPYGQKPEVYGTKKYLTYKFITEEGSKGLYLCSVVTYNGPIGKFEDCVPGILYVADNKIYARDERAVSLIEIQKSKVADVISKITIVEQNLTAEIKRAAAAEASISSDVSNLSEELTEYSTETDQRFTELTECLARTNANYEILKLYCGMIIWKSLSYDDSNDRVHVRRIVIPKNIMDNCDYITAISLRIATSEAPDCDVYMHVYRNVSNPGAAIAVSKNTINQKEKTSSIATWNFDKFSVPAEGIMLEVLTTQSWSESNRKYMRVKNIVADTGITCINSLSQTVNNYTPAVAVNTIY